MMATKAPAANRYQSEPRVPTMSARRTVSGTTSGAPLAEVSATSRSFHTHRNWKTPNELEDTECGDRRGQQRQEDLEEDLDVAGAVHPGGLHEGGRDLLHEVVQQEDRQRQREDRVRQPDGPEGPGQARVDVEGEERDERDLDRDDLEGEDRDEEDVAAPELDPRERVGRQQCQRDRDDHGGQRDDQGVDEQRRE